MTTAFAFWVTTEPARLARAKINPERETVRERNKRRGEETGRRRGGGISEGKERGFLEASRELTTTHRARCMQAR